MSQTVLQPGANQEKTVKTRTAIVIIAGALIFVVLAGILIGTTFFWNKHDASTKEDWEMNLAMARVKQDPNNVQNRVELGWTYFQKGNVDAAVQEYQNALRLDPGNLQAKYNLASAYIQVGRLDEARVLVEEYVKKNPLISAGHSLLGLVYQQQGNYGESIKEFEESIRLVPGNTNVYYQLAISYEKLGNRDKALEYYEQTIAYNPNYAEAKEAVNRLKGK